MNAADAFAEHLADRVAEKVLARLDAVRAPDRISLVRVKEHGAPSAAWVRERARQGLIAIKGPRGERFVDGTALAALLANTTIKRAPRAPAPSGDLEIDAKGAVEELLARKVSR